MMTTSGVKRSRRARSPGEIRDRPTHPCRRGGGRIVRQPDAGHQGHRRGIGCLHGARARGPGRHRRGINGPERGHVDVRRDVARVQRGLSRVIGGVHRRLHDRRAGIDGADLDGRQLQDVRGGGRIEIRRGRVELIAGHAPTNVRGQRAQRRHNCRGVGFRQRRVGDSHDRRHGGSLVAVEARVQIRPRSGRRVVSNHGPRDDQTCEGGRTCRGISPQASERGQQDRRSIERLIDAQAAQAGRRRSLRERGLRGGRKHRQARDDQARPSHADATSSSAHRGPNDVPRRIASSRAAKPSSLK
jgi:hypothetical protein